MEFSLYLEKHQRGKEETDTEFHQDKYIEEIACVWMIVQCRNQNVSIELNSKQKEKALNKSQMVFFMLKDSIFYFMLNRTKEFILL